MPKPIPQSQIDKWKNMPVKITYLSGRPNQHAIDVIMASIEEFMIEKRIKAEDAVTSGEVTSDPVTSKPEASGEAE